MHKTLRWILQHLVFLRQFLMREGKRDPFSINIILIKYVAWSILISNYFHSIFNSAYESWFHSMEISGKH